MSFSCQGEEKNKYTREGIRITRIKCKHSKPLVGDAFIANTCFLPQEVGFVYMCLISLPQPPAFRQIAGVSKRNSPCLSQLLFGLCSILHQPLLSVLLNKQHLRREQQNFFQPVLSHQVIVTKTNLSKSLQHGPL